MTATGQTLQSSSGGPDHDAILGVGLACEIAGRLAEGATHLADAENFYAATALHRQLIEVFHLTACFSLDKTLAARWRTLSESKSAKLRNEFSPAQLRKLLGVSATDYSNHCALSGHPRPGGRVLLPSGPLWKTKITVWSRNANSTIQTTLADIVYSDNLRHIKEVIDAQGRAVDQLGLADDLAEVLAPVWYDLQRSSTNDPMWQIAIAPPPTSATTP